MSSRFLPRFLFGASYRTWRHLLFIGVVAVITFNQVFIVYQDSQSVLGNRIYLICFAQFVLYLAAMYLNYFYLAPRLLLKMRYGRYALSLLAIVLLLPALVIILEFWVREGLDLPHRISDYASPLILVDNLANSTLTGICFCGVSVIMLFRKWMTENENLSWVEERHLKAELDKLKGQLMAPAFLSRSLRNAAALVRPDPQAATTVLMKLGRLLRYQLYDGSRDKVLIQSELNFLEEFLRLEGLNGRRIRYVMQTRGDMRNVYVSPLLLIALLQLVVSEQVALDMLLTVKEANLTFVVQSPGELEVDEATLSLLRKRLELQYPDTHEIAIYPDSITLKIARSACR